VRWRTVVEWGAVCVGSFICAMGFSAFLAPNDIASGGVQGISLIVRAWWGLSPAWTQWMLNVPLYIVGVLVLGRAYGLKTLLGSIALPFFVQLTEHIAPVTSNILWASLLGGLIVGVGVGLVFCACASTGGWDIVAQIVARACKMPLGLAVALCDGFVIACAALVFGIVQALYAWIGLIVMAIAIHCIHKGYGMVESAMGTRSVKYVAREIGAKFFK
jgi:uncharacterized membrane-anchored protein YitT (DUF2179 family)